MPLAGRDKLFVLSRTRDTEIHRESGTMSRRPLANLYPAASFGVSVPLSFYFTENQRVGRVSSRECISQENYKEKKEASFRNISMRSSTRLKRGGKVERHSTVIPI